MTIFLLNAAYRDPLIEIYWGSRLFTLVLKLAGLLSYDGATLQYEFIYNYHDGKNC